MAATVAVFVAKNYNRSKVNAGHLGVITVIAGKANGFVPLKIWFISSLMFIQFTSEILSQQLS
jgi:hypothetical protein